MRKAILHIRPLRTPFIAYLILAVLSFGTIFLSENGWAGALIAGALFFGHSISWSLYEDRLVQRIAGIPVRTILFSEISGLIHRQSRVGYRGRRMPPELLVLLYPGTIEEVSKTNGMLPGLVVRILLNDDQEDSVLTTMGDVCGYVTDGTAVFFHDDPWDNL